MIKKLEKAINEAEQLKSTLKELGFEITIIREINQVNGIIEALEGAAKFITNRDDEK